MHEKFIKFHDTEIKEYEFHQHRSPILINDIDINEIVVNEIVVSNKLPFGGKDFKYFFC